MEITLELQDSENLLNNFEELVSKINIDGYIFLRNVLNKKRVNKVREEILEIFKKYNLIEENTLSEPKWSGTKVSGGMLQPDGEIGLEIAKLKSIEDLYKSKEIIEINRILCGGEVFPWIENQDRVRAYLPGIDSFQTAGQTVLTVTPTHQDNFPFRTIEGKTVQFFTTWVPLMEINETVGGLSIMNNSHKRGYFKHFLNDGQLMGVPSSKKELDNWVAEGAVSSSGKIEPTDNERWIRADYHVGDILIFHPLLVHRGLPNNSNMIRLSADFRYQRNGTSTTWKSKNRLQKTIEFGSEVRRTLRKLGIKGEEAEKIWDKLHHLQGPNNTNEYTLETRVMELMKR